VQALAAATLEHFGRVDVLCSNAGVIEHVSPAWEKSPTDWEWVMGVNLYGLVHAVNAFVPIMIKQGYGHIVSTASNTSLVSASGSAVYVASKKAILGFCETLQYDLWHARSPIKVSVICPNKIATEMPNSARNRPASLPGRKPSAQEVAQQFAWLADGSHTPDEAAAIVLSGIAEERFYILTNPIDGVHAVEWAEGVRSGRLFPLKVVQDFR
jgi:NAD(P)-dependent dehydrogenase (short-subunit alcohol dehydrogenase family)